MVTVWCVVPPHTPRWPVPLRRPLDVEQVLPVSTLVPTLGEGDPDFPRGQQNVAEQNAKKPRLLLARRVKVSFEKVAIVTITEIHALRVSGLVWLCIGNTSATWRWLPHIFHVLHPLLTDWGKWPRVALVMKEISWQQNVKKGRRGKKSSGRRRNPVKDHDLSLYFIMWNRKAGDFTSISRVLPAYWGCFSVLFILLTCLLLPIVLLTPIFHGLHLPPPPPPPPPPHTHTKEENGTRPRQQQSKESLSLSLSLARDHTRT